MADFKMPDMNGLMQAAQQMQAWQQGHWRQLAVTVAAAAAIAVVTMVAPEADARTASRNPSPRSLALIRSRGPAI